MYQQFFLKNHDFTDETDASASENENAEQKRFSTGRMIFGGLIVAGVCVGAALFLGGGSNNNDVSSGGTQPSSASPSSPKSVKKEEKTHCKMPFKVNFMVNCKLQKSPVK